MCYHVCVCVCEYLKNWLIHIDDLIDYLIVDVFVTYMDIALQSATTSFYLKANEI